MRRVTRMTMPRTPEAERDRPGLHARLLPSPFPTTVSPSHPLPGDGRSIDSTRQVILQDSHRRDCAPSTGRVSLAGTDLVGDSEPPAIGGTRAIVPSRDPTLVTIGEPRSLDDGLGSTLPSISVLEHYRWTGKPHTSPSQKVWGFRGLADAIVAAQRTSPGPSIAYPLPDKPIQSLNPTNHSADRDALSPLPIPMPREESNASLSPTTPTPETHLDPSFLRRQSLPLRRQGNLDTLTPLQPHSRPIAHTTLPSPIGKGMSKNALHFLTCHFFSWGVGWHPLYGPLVPRKKVEFFLKQSKPCLKSQNNQTQRPRKPGSRSDLSGCRHRTSAPP